MRRTGLIALLTWWIGKATFAAPASAPIPAAPSQAAARSLGRCSRVRACGGRIVTKGDVVARACELR